MNIATSIAFTEGEIPLDTRLRKGLELRYYVDQYLTALNKSMEYKTASAVREFVVKRLTSVCRHN